jgi:hypothetical protein
MRITERELASIKPYENNPRLNDNAVEAVAAKTTPPVQAKVYGGRYIVTEDGRVFSMTFKGNLHIREHRLREHSHGYLRATIRGRDEYAHRLVAQCFIENPHGYLEVNHKDGDKKNNDASNLEWCTRSENNQHAFRIGLRTNEEMLRYARMPKLARRKFTDQQVKAIREMIHRGCSDRKIARQLNCPRSNIWQIRTGKTYKEVATYA